MTVLTYQLSVVGFLVAMSEYVNCISFYLVVAYPYSNGLVCPHTYQLFITITTVELFHPHVTRPLFASKRARPNIQFCVAFLRANDLHHTQNSLHMPQYTICAPHKHYTSTVHTLYLHHTYTLQAPFYTVQFEAYVIFIKSILLFLKTLLYALIF